MPAPPPRLVLALLTLPLAGLLGGCVLASEFLADDAWGTPHGSAGCGFALRVPPGWTAVADTAHGSFFAQAPARGDGVPERLVVLAWRGGDPAAVEAALAPAEDPLSSFSPGPAPALAARQRLVASERVSVDGVEERHLLLEGEDAGRDVSVALRLTSHGNGTLVVGARVPAGQPQSDDLLRAWRSVTPTGPVTPACGATPGPGQEPPVTEVPPPREGWAWLRVPEGAWWLAHPEAWSAASLSDSGEAHVVASPLEGELDEHRESVMVVVRALPEPVELEALADEVVAQLQARYPDFRLDARAAATVDGAPAIRLESTETHGAMELRAIRLLTILPGDRLALLEAVLEPVFGDAHAQDVETVLASFRASIPLAPTGAE